MFEIPDDRRQEVVVTILYFCVEGFRMAGRVVPAVPELYQYIRLYQSLSEVDQNLPEIGPGLYQSCASCYGIIAELCL